MKNKLMIDIAADRAIIEAATPEPWYRNGQFIQHTPDCTVAISVDDGVFIVEARTRWPAALDEIERQAQHIKTLATATVVNAERVVKAEAERDALVAELVKTKAEVERVDASRCNLAEENVAVKADNAKLRADLSVAIAVLELIDTFPDSQLAWHTIREEARVALINFKNP